LDTEHHQLGEIAMIARTWRGWTTPERADDYLHHFKTDVARNLKSIPGNKEAYLLRRIVDGKVEFLALTFWDSIDAIRKFSGGNPEVAHVEPEGRAALCGFDEFARNYEIVCNTVDRKQDGQGTS
jgi:heme-degrading monooxygenase HmoA